MEDSWNIKLLIDQAANSGDLQSEHVLGVLASENIIELNPDPDSKESWKSFKTECNSGKISHGMVELLYQMHKLITKNKESKASNDSLQQKISELEQRVAKIEREGSYGEHMGGYG